MKVKLALGLGAIATVLLLSSVISVVEYRRMSNYVSDLIAADINSINSSQKLAAACEEYNMKILAVIGDGDIRQIPSFDESAFMDDYAALRSSFSTEKAMDAADYVLDMFAAYMVESYNMEDVMKSDFVDNRQWFFEQLQPKFKAFMKGIETLNDLIHTDLKDNSETFQDGFYRSIMPGIVSVGVGLALVVLLLFFIISYYVNPIYRILSSIDNYRNFGKRYTCSFDGDDELVAINEGITDIIDENMELKKRVSRLREERDKLVETIESQE